MRVLIINPAPEHYTRARCAPLGCLAIASALKAAGHTVKLLNRAINSGDICPELDSFEPDFIGCSLLTAMAVKDCSYVSGEAKKRGVTVVWGGPFVSACPEIVLELDCVDYISVGEGEGTWLEMLETSEKNGDMCKVK